MWNILLLLLYHHHHFYFIPAMYFKKERKISEHNFQIFQNIARPPSIRNLLSLLLLFLLFQFDL
jgi:hypothetical protein